MSSPGIYKTQLVPNRKHITSPLQGPASFCYVRFEVFTAVSVRKPSSGTLRSVAPVTTGVSVESITSIIRVTRIGELGTLALTSNRCIVFLRSVLRLLVTANVPRSSILVTLTMKAISSFETSVLSHTA
jgi:hypothetical protein